MTMPTSIFCAINTSGQSSNATDNGTDALAIRVSFERVLILFCADMPSFCFYSTGLTYQREVNATCRNSLTARRKEVGYGSECF
jgi:hypothetical protein